MGFLAPLYIAGLLAVSLPILFHLIRRTPHGRQDFSSLMFLSPTPPQVTRRSRLTNLLLLLLRAAALTLLAIAFARPFFSQAADANTQERTGRRVALLVDVSASMQRTDLWRQAKDEAEKALADVSPADEVALFVFDDRVRPALTFREWNELEPSRRLPVLRARLAEQGPTWASTRLGDSLATVADLLTENEGAAKSAEKNDRKLVLVSDLQQGSHLEALQGHVWPQNVTLDVRAVAAKQPTNAGLEFVKAAADGSDKADARLRVRVINQPDSAREQFTLTWANDRGPIPGTKPLSVYVPPGHSQVARVAWPAPGDQKPDRLILAGDDHDFDNTLFVVQPRTDAVRVLYIGDDAPDDVKGLNYYLSSALADAPGRKLELFTRKLVDPLTEPELLGTRLVVVGGPLPADRAAVLRRFAENDGTLLYVMTDAAAAPSLGRIANVDNLTATEAPSRDFALIARVETDHPLFAPFADPRFGDFTKIHFWKHRQIKSADATGARVLATFDTGDPFLLEWPIGRGRLLALTSGWQPADSQLALSTKFVPLLNGLLRRPGEATVESQYAVHEPITVRPATRADAKRTITRPDGQPADLPASATAFEATDAPGIYRLALGAGGDETPVAVNVSADESRTAPLAIEDFERWGARLGTKAATEQAAERQRHLHKVELEGRQKVWRWMILAVLGLLAVETALAGRTARSELRQQATP